MQGLRPAADSLDDADTSRLSFLDLLSCALGGAILLFVVFLDFGQEQPQPQPGRRFVWHELRWDAPTAQVAVRLVHADGRALTVPLERTITDSRRIALQDGAELGLISVHHPAQLGREPALTRVIVSGDPLTLQRIRLEAKYVGDQRWTSWSDDMPLAPLPVRLTSGSWQSPTSVAAICELRFNGAWHPCGRPPDP